MLQNPFQLDPATFEQYVKRVPALDETKRLTDAEKKADEKRLADAKKVEKQAEKQRVADEKRLKADAEKAEKQRVADAQRQYIYPPNESIIDLGKFSLAPIISHSEAIAKHRIIPVRDENGDPIPQSFQPLPPRYAQVAISMSIPLAVTQQMCKCVQMVEKWVQVEIEEANKKGKNEAKDILLVAQIYLRAKMIELTTQFYRDNYHCLKQNDSTRE